MSALWIDFRALREKVNMLDVLRHYGVAVKIRGDQATGLCPLPSHPVRTDDRPRTASLSVNLAKGIFKCFGCQARGNVIDFVCLSEGLDPADPRQVRQAVVKLSEWFDVTSTRSIAPTTLTQTGITQTGVTRAAPKAAKLRCANTTASGIDQAEGGAARPVDQRQLTHASESDQDNFEDSTDILINPPLGFTLQHLDPMHPYLINRGFTPETIAYFGLGFCSRGMLKERIAIPLHDANGALIGYAGRLVNDSDISDERPKYLLPGRRKRERMTIDFRKSRFLYNGDRLMSPVENLVVCEGFAGTWWLHQAGYTDVVGLMGSDCSDEQATLIIKAVRPDGRVWVFTDADPAGDACAISVMTRVSAFRFVRRVKIDHGQPTDYPPHALNELLGTCS